MLKKPTLQEFELSEAAGIRHRPTEERFVPYPGKPGDGVWKDGHTIAAADYDMDEVRQMGRNLWAKRIARRKRGR